MELYDMDNTLQQSSFSTDLMTKIIYWRVLNKQFLNYYPKYLHSLHMAWLLWHISSDHT